ncbi:MAG TPA: hypothetical protein QGF58_11545 [Myxococcota bacterium]|nr:hypothetical protein [Myxococcota bacterium]
MMLMVTWEPGKESEDFVNELKSLGNWSNRVPGAWILDTPLAPQKVRDLLGTKMPGERLFVARITQNWAGRNMGTQFPEWMKRRQF